MALDPDIANKLPTPELTATPDQIKQLQDYAHYILHPKTEQTLYKPWQVATGVANAMIGGYFGNQAVQKQRALDTSLASSISGQAQPSDSTQPQASSDTPSLIDRAQSTLGSAFDDASGYVKRLFQVESGGDPNATTGSNRGLGQFSPDMEERYGINNQNRTDPNAQTSAVMQNANVNAPGLRQVLGRDPSPGELYLSHQQGVAGGPALLANPDAPAWKVIRPYYGSDAIAKSAITGNTGQDAPFYGRDPDSITARDFSNYWVKKFERGMPQPQKTASANPGTATDAALPDKPTVVRSETYAPDGTLVSGGQASGQPSSGPQTNASVSPFARRIASTLSLSGSQPSAAVPSLARAQADALTGGAAPTTSPTAQAATNAMLVNAVAGRPIAQAPQPQTQVAQAAPSQATSPAQPQTTPPGVMSREEAEARWPTNQIFALARNPETRAIAIQMQEQKQAALHPGPAQPTFGKIGTDQYGNDSMGWINQRTQTTTPAGVRNGQQVTAQTAEGGGAPGNQDLHGEDYLKTLPDSNYAAQVKRIADGLDTIPGRLEGTPYGRQMKLAVVQYDPTFDTSDYGARAKARANFTSGKNADIANKLNTAVLHLSELSDDAQKLNNWPSGTFGPLTSTVNQARTSYREGGQDPAISNFKNTAGKVAEELTSAYRGAGGAEADIKREMDNLNAAQSPEQVNQAIHKMSVLMQGKISAQQFEYEQAMGRGAHPLTMMKPGTQDVIDRLSARANPPKQPEANGSSAQANGQQPASAAPSTAPTIVNKQTGQRMTIQGGKWVPIQ